MSSLERKLRRKQDKQIKKFEKEVRKKLMMFDSTPDNCLTCQESFDKKSKEHAMSWRIVIKEERVNLYCPNCWGLAEKIIKKHGVKK